MSSARAKAVSSSKVRGAAWTAARSAPSLATSCDSSEYRPLALDASRTRSRISLRQLASYLDEERNPDDADTVATEGPPAVLKSWGPMEIALHRQETKSSPATTKVCDSRVGNAYPSRRRTSRRGCQT
jgi:hypothetical protein